MANDILSAETADALRKKVPFEQALWLVGSYSRLDWAVKKVQLGLIPQEALLKLLPDIWRGSDPDDTDARFLSLWEEAWKQNAQQVICDDKHLPKGKMLTVYRGQDEDAPLGIAWTLRIIIAQRFARGAALRQSNREGIILKAKIERNRIMGYLTGRNEFEVILNPTHLTKIYKI